MKLLKIKYGVYMKKIIGLGALSLLFASGLSVASEVENDTIDDHFSKFESNVSYDIVKKLGCDEDSLKCLLSLDEERGEYSEKYPFIYDAFKVQPSNYSAETNTLVHNFFFIKELTGLSEEEKESNMIEMDFVAESIFCLDPLYRKAMEEGGLKILYEASAKYGDKTESFSPAQPFDDEFCKLHSVDNSFSYFEDVLKAREYKAASKFNEEIEIE